MLAQLAANSLLPELALFLASKWGTRLLQALIADLSQSAVRLGPLLLHGLLVDILLIR